MRLTSLESSLLKYLGRSAKVLKRTLRNLGTVRPCILLYMMSASLCCSKMGRLCHSQSQPEKSSKIKGIAGKLKDAVKHSSLKLSPSSWLELDAHDSYLHYQSASIFSLISGETCCLCWLPWWFGLDHKSHMLAAYSYS
mmetsp:Transcript_113343/g.178292  ORF Transcript_113343/g.178292 Transcript_113343/m.178292 type:complete len:139 (-) Transcript_113343:281-697(-)